MTRAEHDRPDQGDVVVRPARPADRDAVLAFCAGPSSGAGGDYVAYVWDDWLADDAGALLVAARGDRPVGLVHVRPLSESEAWIEGIRVAPGERRRGIGRLLISRALVASRDRGAAIARLLTDADNAPARALVARFGFTRVAELARYAAPALLPDAPGTPADVLPAAVELVPATGARLTTPGEDDFDRLWDWLVQSNLTPFNGGLEINHWAARALSEPALRAYLAAGDVWTLEEYGQLQALAVARPVPAEDDEPARLAVVYADGMADGLGRLALALREIAGERGSHEVELWLPTLLILRDAMQGAGYTPQDDSPLEIYARTL